MQTKPGSETWTDPDDAPELTEAMLADAEVFQGDEFVKRGPGRPKTGNARELISVRLDRDVVARLREAGPGWQSRVNPMLRAALGMDRGSPAQAFEIAGAPGALPQRTVRSSAAAKASAVQSPAGRLELVRKPRAQSKAGSRTEPRQADQ